MTCHKDKIGQAVNIVGAVGVFGNAQRIVNSGMLGGRVHPSNRANVLGRNSGDLLRFLWRVVFDLFADGVKALCMFVDKGLIV